MKSFEENSRETKSTRNARTRADREHTDRNRRRNRSRRRHRESPAHVRPESAKWKVTRLIDERTGNSCLGVDFPTRLNGRAFEVMDDDLVEQPAKIRNQLKKRGAAFQGTKKQQIAFVKELLNEASSETLILAMKPGFRKDGFILGNRMFGAAQGKYRWKTVSQNLGSEEIGDTRGDFDAWTRDVGTMALKSYPLSFGILVGLAACIPSYVRLRMEDSADLQPLLSETATFNFEGDSGSGRTSIARAVAGLIGPPHLIGKWDFTRRGLEEWAESRNDLPCGLDDTESHVDDGLSLKTALRYVTQIIPKGVSKHMAKKAVNADLPMLYWSNCGLTTSPPNMEKTARDIGWNRTDGERARFICIPVSPVSKGGIFDGFNGSDAKRVELGKSAIKQLERGIAQNYGLIFPKWIKFLLNQDYSKRLIELAELFVNRVAGHGDGWDVRHARKFGLLYAVGRLAIQAGILPWPGNWPRKAVTRCYRRALRAIRTEQQVAKKTVTLIASSSADRERFIRTGSKTSAVINLPESSYGIRTRYRGKQVLALRDGTMRMLAGGHKTSRIVIAQLETARLLRGGHGRRRTTQLPVRIRVAGKTISKPRFLLIDLRRLRSHVKSP
jgi:hypothetical protein